MPCVDERRIFAAPLKEQHLAIRSCKDTQHDRSVALAHKTQAEAAVKTARARLAQLRSTGRAEAVIQVCLLACSFFVCPTAACVIVAVLTRIRVSSQSKGNLIAVTA
jgi:predicted phage tail protein